MSDQDTIAFFTMMMGGEPRTTCRHGHTEPHGYGMSDEPDYDGGPILDIMLHCDGKPFIGRWSV